MRENWTYKKLGEVCTILDSQRKPVTKKDRTKGIYPYYGASGIQDYVDSYLFEGRFLLVGEDGAKWCAFDKSAYIIEGKSWVNNHAHILEISKGTVDTYIEYYLTYKDLSGYITGAIVPKLTQKSLVSIPIPIPPLSEQQSIVAELDKINELISLKKAQLKDLDALAQSIFYDMFGDPIENEKGWEVKKYGDCFAIGAGGTPSKSKNEYWENGNIPWIGSNMCQNCVIKETDGRFITEEGLNHSSAKLLDVDTVLVALVGATIGKVALLKTKTSTNQNVAFIKVNESKDFISEYVYFHLMNQYSEFLMIGNGDFKMANQAFIKSLSIMTPPLSIQQDFAKRIELIEQQKAQISSTIKDLETLLAARMQYWFD